MIYQTGMILKIQEIFYANIVHRGSLGIRGSLSSKTITFVVK